MDEECNSAADVCIYVAVLFDYCVHIRYTGRGDSKVPGLLSIYRRAGRLQRTPRISVDGAKDVDDN